MHRLTSPRDFSRVIKSGGRAGSSVLVVHEVLDGPRHEAEAGAALPGPARVGFVVSKAVGNAVVRNRVKRRLRHLCKEQWPTLPDGGMIVVRAMPGSANASYAELRVELSRCLSRAQKRAGSAR